MRRTLRSVVCAAFLLSLTGNVFAQNDRFAYVISDATKEGSSWSSLRKLDFASGTYTDVLIKGSDAKAVVYDALSRKELQQAPDAHYGTLFHAPFSTGVAAAAYDRDRNRLYFTPMFIDQLRYIDLRTNKVYYVTDQAFTKMGNMHNDEGKCITRMVISPDGTGYAISNDGNTFIQFTTGKKMTITQLGSLVDDPSNGALSIHNKCSSYGGDMIADNKGNLYIISARNHVYRVDPATKVAKHLGHIEGLPAQFTVNGAVVDDEGTLLVSSAVYGDAYYVVNPKNWEASIYESAKGVFRSSDLANSNYLGSGTRRATIETIPERVSTFDKLIQVYPNPVTTDQFTLQFDKVPAGDYTVQLMDVMGRSVLSRSIKLNAEMQTEPISLRTAKANGIYMVKIMDRAGRLVYEKKIMIH
jgi:hypothetical protein